jgi:hypothetical protein
MTIPVQLSFGRVERSGDEKKEVYRNKVILRVA